MRHINFSKLSWGIFLLAIAALVLINHFGGFVALGVWSIMGTSLALAVIVHSIAKLSLSGLPFPLALLYYIFQIPLGLPIIGFWTLAVVALISTIGLAILLPKRKSYFGVNMGYSGSFDDDYDEEDGNEDRFDTNSVGNRKRRVEEGGTENNPVIGVSFGGVSRYLHATALESAVLNCSFGSLEVYFDQVELCPEGAEARVECSFGSVELYVPRHWRIINKTRCSFGAAEIDDRHTEAGEKPPTLVVSGNVSFGGLEVYRTRG